MTRRNLLPAESLSHRDCCSIKGFSECNCSVQLPGRGEKWFCISGTKYQAGHSLQGKLCDLMLWWSKSPRIVTAAIELKSGTVDVGNLLGQLQAGANLIDQLSGEVSLSFTPVLYHKRMHVMDTRALRRRFVTFRGRKYSVQLLRCGDHVERILS